MVTYICIIYRWCFLWKRKFKVFIKASSQQNS